MPPLMAQRYELAFKSLGGRGRVRPGEPTFARAVCLVLIEATGVAQRTAGEIGRYLARSSIFFSGERVRPLFAKKGERLLIGGYTNGPSTCPINGSKLGSEYAQARIR